MRRARCVNGRVIRARLAETPKPELARIASPAGFAVGAGIIAAAGDRVIDDESKAELDDLALGHVDQWRAYSNCGFAFGFDARASRKIGHLLERGDEFGTAVGISAVVERVYAHEYLSGPDYLRECDGVREENRVSGGDVSDRNPG